MGAHPQNKTKEKEPTKDMGRSRPQARCREAVVAVGRDSRSLLAHVAGRPRQPSFRFGDGLGNSFQSQLDREKHHQELDRGI